MVFKDPFNLLRKSFNLKNFTPVALDFVTKFLKKFSV